MRNKDDIEISEIGVNAFNKIIGSFNWGNDNRYTPDNTIAWGIDCYNEGVNLVREYGEDLSIKDESGELKFLYPLIEERANDYAALTNSQLLEVFYYFNLPKSFNYEYHVYFSDLDVSSDINDVIRYGVFLLARDLIVLGYERRDDGEA